MDKKILKDIISAEPFYKLSSEELTKELDEETAKQNPDYDLVDELTAAIIEEEWSDIGLDVLQAELEIIKNSIKRRNL